MCGLLGSVGKMLKSRMFSLNIIILGCFLCALSLAVAAAENVVAVKNLELEGSNHHNALVHVSSIPTSSVFVCAYPSSTTTCYICGSITGSSNGYTTYNGPCYCPAPLSATTAIPSGLPPYAMVSYFYTLNAYTQDTVDVSSTLNSGGVYYLTDVLYSSSFSTCPPTTPAVNNYYTYITYNGVVQSFTTARYTTAAQDPYYQSAIYMAFIFGGSYSPPAGSFSVGANVASQAPIPVPTASPTAAPIFVGWYYGNSLNYCPLYNYENAYTQPNGYACSPVTIAGYAVYVSVYCSTYSSSSYYSGAIYSDSRCNTQVSSYFSGTGSCNCALTNLYGLNVNFQVNCGSKNQQTNCNPTAAPTAIPTFKQSNPTAVPTSGPPSSSLAVPTLVSTVSPTAPYPVYIQFYTTANCAGNVEYADLFYNGGCITDPDYLGYSAKIVCTSPSSSSAWNIYVYSGSSCAGTALATSTGQGSANCYCNSLATISTDAYAYVNCGGTAPSCNAASSSSSSGGGGSSTGAIAGGVVGGLAFVAVIAACVCFFKFRKTTTVAAPTVGEKEGAGAEGGSSSELTEMPTDKSVQSSAPVEVKIAEGTVMPTENPIFAEQVGKFV